MSLPEIAAIPSRWLFWSFPGFGFVLGTMFQLVPSQCSTAAIWESLSESSTVPATHTLLGDRAVMATGPKRGWELTRLQLVPFQCKMAWPVPRGPQQPTAQTSLLASAETASMLPTLLNAVLETLLQVLPFQCSTKALLPPSPP